MDLDAKHKSILRQDAIKKEMDQIAAMGTFWDHGRGAPAQSGYRKISALFSCETWSLSQVSSCCRWSSCQSAKGFCWFGCCFFAILTSHCLVCGVEWIVALGSFCWKCLSWSFGKGKGLCFAGPDFGDSEDHILLINKALYGIHNSNTRWHEHFANPLCDLGFTPCNADPDIWMKNCGTHYEYICVYVDNLGLAIRNAQECINDLVNNCGY